MDPENLKNLYISDLLFKLKFMKKIFLILFSVLIINLVPNLDTFASSNTKEVANKYIQDASTFDYFWKGKNPKIVSEKLFYSGDENKPSYIEYKVSCDDRKDCGYVMVNLDGTDVDIPEASSVGQTPSEMMGEMSGKNSKNYYFSVFEQFSENPETGEIGFINPDNEQLVEKASLNTSYSINSVNSLSAKSQNLGNNTSKLKEKLQKLKDEAKKEKPINKPINTLNGIIKSSGVVPMNDGRVTTPNPNSGAMVGDPIIDTYCLGYTPCYRQTYVKYDDGKYRISGCVSTAFSILYGFYDRNGKDKFFPGEVAPESNTYSVQEIQRQLTSALKTENGSTYEEGYQGGVNYLNNIYPKTQEILRINDLNQARAEIDNGRPFLMSYEDSNGIGHSIVIHGYQGFNKLYGNFGWGKHHANRMINFNGKTFTSHADNGTFNRFHFIRFN
ncbi:hypothetical protein BLD25_02055 [Candidatus Gracilibacteria bacterium GN02-872]|nr:hypothetical protein BLD25_02055 [Candidatus Gracilibacteria bacterium GN02-872]